MNQNKFKDLNTVERYRFVHKIMRRDKYPPMTFKKLTDYKLKIETGTKGFRVTAVREGLVKFCFESPWIDIMEEITEETKTFLQI